MISPLTWHRGIEDDALGSESPFVAVGRRISGGSNDPHWAHRAVGAEHGEMDGRAADGWPMAGEVQLALTFAGEWPSAFEDLPSRICNLEGGVYLGSFLGAGSTGSVLPGLLCQSRGLLINQCTVSWPVCRCIRYLTSYRGMRVGGASHPGPGQNAQKWKRAAQQQAAQLKQIMQLLQALLGCIKGGGIAEIGSLLAPAIETPRDPRAKARGPKPGPKAKAKAKAKAKSQPTPRVPAPHQPALPSHTPVMDAAAPVTAASPESPQVPKPRRQAPQQASQAGQTVTRAVYALRPSDWHGTVLPYENLEQELRNRGSGPIVVLAGSAQEADVAAQLVAGHGRHAAWILYRERQAQLTVPMTTGGQLRPQHVLCRAWVWLSLP